MATQFSWTSVGRILRLAAFSCLLLSLSPPGSLAQEDEEPDQPPLFVDPRQAVAHLADDSRLKVTLADEPVVIETAHGKLSIPAADILRIDFALRLSKQQQEQLDHWIADLGSLDPLARRQATAKLLGQRGRAVPALELAAKEGSPEIAKEADAILDRLWSDLPLDELDRGNQDVIITLDARVTGRIVAPQLKVQTEQFGTLDLKLADARTLRSLAYVEPEQEEQVDPKGALPDPGNLKGYETQVGKKFIFKVVGAASGTLYGEGTYTTDSVLAAAAVHLGILKAGEEGIVQVTILGQVPSYTGSTRNGLTSSSYSGYPGFELKKAKKTRPPRKK